LDGIFVEINNCEKHRENGANHENGNTINDNIVFYVCGTLENRKRRGCQDCCAILNGSSTPPPEMSVRYLQEREIEGTERASVCSKKLYELAMQLETAFLRTVSDNTIFNRDSYEAICHDVLLNKLHTT
jgi:hypothetical protein